jgi:germination protein M
MIPASKIEEVFHMLRRWGVVLIALLVSVVWGISGCGKQPETPEPTGQAGSGQEVVAPAGETKLRDTVLYYRDASGYLVPVMRQIPWEEGIGRAALRFLVAGTEDDVKLAARGVYAPLPAGTQIDLDISDGLATVDLIVSGECESAAHESAMVSAVVNTLLEFDTVDEVEIWLNGKDLEKLPLGTDVSACFTEPIHNIEPVGAPAGREGKFELYFTNQSGTFLIPVLRVLDAATTPAEAVEEMMAPAEGSGLVSLLPPVTDVHSVTISEDGVATIDLSGEFESLSELPGMERMAVRGLILTLTQFKNIEDVQITINGKPYEPTAATMAGLGSQYLNIFG